MDFKVEVDMKRFDDVFKDYMYFSKKQPAEIVNAKLYFIALESMNLTKKADGNAIRSQLSKPSHKNPKLTLGQILAYADLKKRGKMPKKSRTLAGKVEKFIKRRIHNIQFLRSGWIPAMKKLDFWNKRGDIRFVKRYAPKKPEGIKTYGKEKGSANPAALNESRVRGWIENWIGQGKQASKTVTNILRDGLQKGVNKEIASMRIYIEKKFNTKHDEMKRKGM